MVLLGLHETLLPGDVLRKRNQDLFPDEEVVVVKVVGAPHPPVHSVYCAKCQAKILRTDFAAPNFTVILDRAIPSAWNVSDNLYSTDRQASGFILRNGFVYSKGRGALVKAPHGLIENNYFVGGTAGVEVSPELSGSSGSDACVGYALVIRNNTIVHTGYHETFDDPFYGADGAIAFFSSASNATGVAVRGPTAFVNMLIANNTFQSVNGLNIGITSGNGVVIYGNKFCDTHPIAYSTQSKYFGFNNGYVVYMTETANVTLIGNYVYGEGRYKIGNLYVSPSVYRITGISNGIVEQNTTML